MYLKSIEVQGFKSFANKIVFKFEEGITGIVGPNGSGKSNVADAVRWVLGEQKIKQLRGSSMQDVIFSGTELRKPLSYAFVAITLDNSDHKLAFDFDEVTVARRLYRSGESEYLINGTVCRLKDVYELFYDTGIGKEGYSIIGQGQIDKILSGKPEERRELFDEAAGIVKYKRRKEAAEKKLESEESNLLRVKDILSEIERQIGPLEKQAETAKIYLHKIDELKTLDVNVFLLENEQLNSQLRTVTQNLEIATADFEDTNSLYEKIKEEYTQIEELIATLSEKIETSRSELSDSSIMREKLEGEINVLREQIKSAGVNVTILNEQLEKTIADMNSAIAKKDTVLEEKGKNKAAFDSLTESRKEAEDLLKSVQCKIDELTDIIENGKNTIISELNHRASVKTEIGRYDTMKEQIVIRKADLNSKILRARSEEEKQDEEIKNLIKTRENISAQLEKMNKDLSEGEAKVEKVRAEIAAEDKEIRDLQLEFHQDKSKLDALINLTERYEGYGGSVKKVMEQKEANKGIIGVVADIIKVEEKYETAIETALGGNIQNIVTDDENTAKKMIAFLKKNKLGRATFLPLTSIKEPQEFKTPEVLDEEGVIGMADEIVTTDKRYKDVAKAMLGRIVVVDNVDNAIAIARKYKYGVRMVTLEGELFVPGGAISGGAFKNNSNLLGRRRELEELEAKTKAIRKRMDELAKHIEEQKSVRNSLRMEVEALKADIQRKYIEENTAKVNIESAMAKKNEVILSSKDLEAEGIEIEVQIKDIEKKKLDIQVALQTSEELEKKITSDIAKAQEELETTRVKESEFSVEVSRWDLEINKILQQQDFVNQNLLRLEDEISRYGTDAEDVKNRILAYQDEITSKEKDIERLEITIKESHSTQDKKQTEMSEDISTRDSLSAKQKGFFEKREDLAKRIGDLDKEIYRLTANKEKIESQIEAQINYMWETYEITLSDASGLKNPELNDLSAMKKEISIIKDQIKRLGNVNVNAINEYKEIMERYTFLKEQHDDLVAAKETLLGIISELDTAMRKQFTESFKDINAEFDKVFKELFGGGKGTLELIEDEDILEAGIRIIAQPPGKKLQNMMQLSGGEKALTAIALLFAIQNLKPSPFCLLDEIEAALDESNVDRFAKYLHKLTKHTQFIVITHRRGTMERADRLYGITMQEKGVSALVSVNLIDNELDD